MKRLRVLASAYACNPTGSLVLHPGEDLTGWRLVHEVARRHEVHVITHVYNRPGIEAAPAAVAAGGPVFHFLDLSRRLRKMYKVEFAQRIYYYLWQIAAWRLARRLHRERPFDLAHHVTFGNDWIASFIGAFLPVPYVHGPVGGGQTTPRPLFREYTRYGRFAERSRRTAQWFGRRDPIRLRALRKAGAILVCNRETREKVPARLQAKAFDFPVNGMDRSDLMVFPDAPPADGVFRILSAGRFHRLKGFALAIKAFALFAAGRSDVEFILIGQGEEEERIREVIRSRGIGNRVRIVPWLPRRELLLEMARADVMAFASFRDGGGAVVVEAMAAGKPIVGLDSGGPGFHIRPEWGIKIRPDDPEIVIREMAAAFETLYSDPGKRAAMGRAARARVEDFYLYEKQGERLEEIYTLALGGADAGRVRH